jgi:dUTP pyrophosphatase
MEIKFIKLNGRAVSPTRAHYSDAGADLVALSAVKEQYGLYSYGTGIAIELPPGHVGLLFPRSSITKTGATLGNSIGVIDESYRGEIFVKFYADEAPYLIGDRVAQLIIIPIPRIVFKETTTLSETVRGANGFGSTGK